MALDELATEPDRTFETDYPVAPKTIADTGMGINFLLALLIKTVYVNGLESATAIRDHVKLPTPLVSALLKDGAGKDLFEPLGTGEGGKAEMRYALTAKGREWALESLDHSSYVGPAPVVLKDYYAQARKQSLTNELVRPDGLARCLSNMVLEEDFVAELGAAITSGRSILFYGPAGNGKTSVAKAMIDAFSDAVYVPYAIEVDGQVITVFDSSVHKPEAAPAEENGGARPSIRRKAELDARWVRCRRPVVMAGGELTLEMLDLSFSPHSRVYGAPLQLKASGGIFIIDDFGRQSVRPAEILNRWVVPLETQVDYLTLQTGRKFPVPFDELLILSTNMEPSALLDDAMNRRIQYKMEVGAPSREAYVRIFERACAEAKIAVADGVLEYLLSEFYDARGVALACFHPGWIVQQAMSRCTFQGTAPRVDRALALRALRNLDTGFGGLRQAGSAVDASGTRE
jgi:hypothetical protein